MIISTSVHLVGENREGLAIDLTDRHLNVPQAIEVYDDYRES